MKTDATLIFEKTRPGRKGVSLSESPWSGHDPGDELDASLLRSSPADLPEVSELDVVRHYTNMSRKNFGVENGFYPLGSCTMKYNPKINDEVQAMPAFKHAHPDQPVASVQGILKIYHQLAEHLSDISGMAETTLNTCAGAHGELTGLMIMKAYHAKNGDHRRTKVIVPDSAHGTNPASTSVAGMDVVEIESNDEGRVMLSSLKEALGDDVAGMMLTNPNTLGIFEKDICEITDMVHEAGGLMYYDGANLNAMLGKVRPGDMGFDIVHLNLHKTFSTPHGGGGPGSGPVGVSERLREFLPSPRVREDGGMYYLEEGNTGIGRVTYHLGNVLVWIRAYAYVLTLGRENIKDIGWLATLNANYVRALLRDDYQLPIGSYCMHECVFDGLKDNPHGVRTLDVAKRIIEEDMHAPTVYFPLLFKEAIMIEPTETESKETLDHFVSVMKTIAAEAKNNPGRLKDAPLSTPVRRIDEVFAARQLILTYRDYLDYQNEEEALDF